MDLDTSTTSKVPGIENLQEETSISMVRYIKITVRTGE